MGLVCRQGRLAGVLLAAFLTALLLGMPIGVWWLDHSWLFVVISGLAAAVTLPFLVQDVRARFRETNWVLWVRPSGVSINLRSYQDESSLDLPSVLELSDNEITQVRRRIERYTVPSSKGGAIHHKLESLDIDLRLADPRDARELSAAIAAVRNRPQPQKTYLGFIKGTSELTLYSVSMPTNGVVRIAWSGGQNHGVKPSFAKILDLLAQRVRVGETVTEERGDWRELEGEELDDQILGLVAVGNVFDAVKLLHRRKGYSLTEARKFVDDLAPRVGADSAAATESSQPGKSHQSS